MTNTHRISATALAVAASHVDYRIAGLNPGVSAVVGFYLISGYVMAGLLQRHYPTPAQAVMVDLQTLVPETYTFL